MIVCRRFMSRDRFLVRVPVNGRQFQVRGQRYTVLVKDASERSGVGGWTAHVLVMRDAESMPVLLDVTERSLSTMDVGSVVEGVLEKLAAWVALVEADRPDAVSL
jgi:hypothetical protein